MMLQVMAYTVAVAAALGAVGICIERVAGLHGLPRRAAWIAAMLLSVLFPAAMMLSSPSKATPERFTHLLEWTGSDARPDSADRAQLTAAVERQGAAWMRPPSDRVLITIWAAASLSFVLYLSGASFLLRRRVSGWRQKTVLGHDVLISEVTGPALLGVLVPSIVVPRWLLAQPSATQALILEHEQQHLKARDPLLMVTGLFVIAAVPWNLPLWWQWRRMRQAVEMDCDARVLRAGADATTYAEVLLAVTRRATRTPAGALAMSEPVASLERRIDSLVPGEAGHVMGKTLVVLVLAAVAAGIALALRAPALLRTVASTPIQLQIVEAPASPGPVSMLAPEPVPAIAPVASTRAVVTPVVFSGAATTGTSKPLRMLVVDDPRQLDEIVAEARAQVPEDVLRSRTERILTDNDPNRDGIITRQEARDANKALNFVWTQYDRNRDGVVTAAEVARFTEALEIGTAVEKLGGDAVAAGLARKPAPGTIMAINDSNGDGTVTREEAARAGSAMSRMWHVYDLNSDDRVDAAEIARASGY